MEDGRSSISAEHLAAVFLKGIRLIMPYFIRNIAASTPETSGFPGRMTL